MKCNISLLLLFLPFVFALAQPPDTVWTSSFDPEWFGGEATSVQQTADGGYIVGGASFFLLHQLYTSVYVLKTDSVGNQIWSHDYDSDYMPISEAYDVQQTADGGYIVAATVIRGTPGTLFKIDSLGNVQWERTYGYRAYAVRQTSDGGYVTCGDYTFSLCKTDSLGNEEWHVTLPASLYDVQPAIDGGYCAAGAFRDSSEGSWDFYAVKTNEAGDTLWTRTYGESAGDWAYSICAAQNGEFLMAGCTYSFTGDADVYLVDINGNGDTLWTRFYGSTEYDEAISVALTLDGGFIIAGFTNSLGYSVPYLIRINSFGDTLWTKMWGPGGWGGFFSVQQTSDSGYIAAGQYNGLIYLAKLGADPLPAAPRNIAALPSQYSLVVYPNPFNPTITIQYDVKRPAKISLKVFDLLGREVATLVNRKIPAGSHKVSWDAKGLSTGVYFCRMEAEHFVETRKILLLK